MSTFTIPPAVIATAAPPRFVVDLFEAVLSDIPHNQRTRPAALHIVEAVAPRVPPPEAPHLGPRAASGERIACRDDVADRMCIRNVDVDAQHLTEQLGAILRAMFRIVAGSAVAEADVEEPVGPEGEMPAVVVRKGLLDQRRRAGAVPAKIEPRRWIGDEWICRATKARNYGMTGRIGEVHVEAAAAGVVRRERETEQPAFAARGDRRLKIEKVG